MRSQLSITRYQPFFRAGLLIFDRLVWLYSSSVPPFSGASPPSASSQNRLLHSSSEGGIQTFSQQLPTKKGVDRIQPSASAQPSTTPGHTHHAPPHAPVQTMARSVTSKPAGAAASTSSSVGGRSPADGNLRSTSPSFDGSHKALHASSAIGGVDSVGASQIYHWEDGKRSQYNR